MALGALIAAYQEDDEGGLRALLPLAGQSLIEYQARCAFAAGAAPIVVIVERIPAALNEAFDGLRQDGINVIAVSDGIEAASRFEAGALILLVGDGIVAHPQLAATLADQEEPCIATLPDDPEHERFERIDAQSRWAGLAVVEGHMLASTAAMLGDWDLQSTLLRRTLQEGAILVPLTAEEGEPLLIDKAEQLDDFERAMMAASRGARRDFVSRYLLPPVEEIATNQILQTRIRPSWLTWGALGLTLAAAAAFLKGWPVIAAALLLLSTPLDLIAGRVATLRLRPLPATALVPRLLWPAAGIALAALGLWSSRNGGGWGAMVCALTAIAFAEAARTEAPAPPLGGEIWLFSRRNAIVLLLPFAVFGAWNSGLAVLAFYAAGSFFLLQHVRHRLIS